MILYKPVVQTIVEVVQHLLLVPGKSSIEVLGSWYLQLGERVLDWFKIAPNMELSMERLIGLNNQENHRIDLCLPIYKAC